MRRAIIDVPHNNGFGFEVWKNGARVEDLSTITRVKVSFAGVEIDSNDDASAFSWTSPQELDENGAEIVVCEFGGFDLPNGKHGAIIVVYDGDNPSGVVLTRGFPLEVINHGGGVAPSVGALTLDDIPDGTSYSRVLASAVLGGEVLVSGLSGDLDDLDDGTTYSRVKSATLTVDGLIFLDAVEDTGNYQKVSASALDASGLVIWEELVEAVPGSLPEEGATDGATAGTNLRDSFLSLLGDSDVITSMGTAAFLNGQGVLATLDSVNLDTQVDDGVTYQRIQAAALTVAGLVQLDATVEGTYARAHSSALDASGLVLLDEVQIGTTYDLLAKTYVTAGKIEVTGTSPFSDTIPVTMTDADGTKTTIDGGLITTGGIALSTAGYLRAGKTSFADATAGWWLGDDGGTPKLNIGSSTKKMEWDGTDLSVTGRIIADGNLAGQIGPTFGDSTDAYHISIGRALNATGLTATDPAADIATNYTSDGQLHVYFWDTSAWVEVANAGIETEGADDICLLGGTYDTGTAGDRMGVFGRSYTHHAIHGTTKNNDDAAAVSGVVGLNTNTGSYGYGVSGSHSGSGIGTRGSCTTGTGVHGRGRVGVVAVGLSTINGGNMELPSIDSGVPTHSPNGGTLFTRNNGGTYELYWYDGSSWIQVA